MDLGLSGRRALVTAASRGLGRACAAALVAEGAQVFIASREESAIRGAAEEMGASGWLAADIASAEAVEMLVARATQTLGGLEILVVNAGGPPPGVFTSTTEADWERGFQLTLMSAVRLARAALPHLLASGHGRIVNLTSTSVREPIPNILLSNAFRAGVVGMAKTLSAEVAGRGVTVNNIAPGRILTDRVRQIEGPAAEKAGITLEDQLERAGRLIPAGRLGRPEELGALCAYLCSDQAAYITGQTIAVDGGLLKGVY